MNFFLLAIKKILFTSNLTYHQKPKHLHLEVPYLPRALCCQVDVSSSTLVKKVSQWQNYDCISAPNSKRCMLLQLFVVSFLHLRQACQLFLLIVYCVHLHSISWWRSWVLQRLQIFGFFFLQCCHEETSQHGDACVLFKHCLSNLRCIWFIIYVVIFWLHIVFIFVPFLPQRWNTMSFGMFR